MEAMKDTLTSWDMCCLKHQLKLSVRRQHLTNNISYPFLFIVIWKLKIHHNLMI